MKKILIFALVLITATLNAQRISEAKVANVLAGETLNAWDWCYIGSDGKAYKANYNDYSNAVTCAAINDAVLDDTMQVAFSGVITGYVGIVKGKEYFLSPTTDGGQTEDRPTTGKRQRLGEGIGDSIFLMGISIVESVTDETVLKGSDEARNSSTTLLQDTDLQYPLDASSQYIIKTVAVLSTANSLMNYKFSTSYSGTMADGWYNVKYLESTAVNPLGIVGSGLVTSTPVISLVSGFKVVEVEQYIQTTTGGIYSFNWAQNTSNASDLTTKAGSYIKVKKL